MNRCIKTLTIVATIALLGGCSQGGDSIAAKTTSLATAPLPTASHDPIPSTTSVARQLATVAPDCSLSAADGAVGVSGLGTATWPRVDNGVTLHLWRKVCGFDVTFVELPEANSSPSAATSSADCSLTQADGAVGIPGVGTATWPRVDKGVTLHLWRKVCGFDVSFVELAATATTVDS